MRKTSSAILAVLVAAAFPAATFAAERDPGVNQRQHTQQQRVQQGVRSGDLTRSENRSLQGQARDIRSEVRSYRSDGNFSRAERADVHRDLNHQSRDIRAERHDDQRRTENYRDGNGHLGYGRFDNGHAGNGHPGYGRFDGGPAGDGHRGYGNPGNGRADAGNSGFRQFTSRDIDRMQQNERERIQRGIRSGELTRSEADRLIGEQRQIAREERVYRADGVLTRAEREDLRQDLSAANRSIYQETHDAQVRLR